MRVVHLLHSLPTLGPACSIILNNNGADWGARINVADAILGTKPGSICCYGGGNIASQIILNAGISPLRILRFGAGTWSNSLFGVPTILMNDNTTIEGHGWDTILQEMPDPDPGVASFTISYAGGGALQKNNLIVRNLQLSGVGVTRPGNGITAAIISGLLQTGLFQNIWFNKTHAIGLTLGESNVNNNAVCQDVRVLGCKYTNVGGGIPPDYSGGGGVTLAIINGNRILVDNCTFIDALGNAVIDLEPNTLLDPITNITISNSIISQELTTGNCEKNVYGIAIHTQGLGAPVGPIKIKRLTIKGTYGQDALNANQFAPAGTLYTAIYVNFGSTPGQSYKVTAKDCVIQGCLSFPFVADGADDNVFKNLICTICGDDALISGSRNIVRDNTITTISQQNGKSGIQERNPGDFNTFLNNTVTKAAVIVGAHSTSVGEIIVSPSSFPPVYTPLPSGTLATQNANDLLLAIALMGGHLQSLAPLIPLQVTNAPAQLADAVFAPGYQILTKADSYTSSWTNTETLQWLVAMLALKGSPTLVQQIDAGQMISATPALTPSTTGGTMTTGTYYYRWAGVYHGGEFLTPEVSVAVTGPTGSVAFLGNLFNGPAFPSYKIYKGTAPGVYTSFFTTASLSFTDTGAAGTAGSPPAALSYTGTLGATPTNGNSIALMYSYHAHVPTRSDLSTVSVGGIALTKGPSVSTPWGIASIWTAFNVQGATNGIVTATLASNPPGQGDKIWFNAMEWAGVTAIDVQGTNSFPLTW